MSFLVKYFVLVVFSVVFVKFFLALCVELKYFKIFNSFLKLEIMGVLMILLFGFVIRFFIVES